MAERLSPTMLAVLARLKAGDGRLVPLRGGFWLPGDVAAEVPQEGEVWFDRSLAEFGAKVGTRTVQGLVDRGLLRACEPGFDSRRSPLRVHSLTEQAADHG